MKEIITDLEKLLIPAKPLSFITDTGITKEEGESIIKELTEVLQNNKDLLALAAPQIGIDKRIFCIKFNDDIKAFINPILKKKGDPIVSYETCASLPGKEIAISRPQEIEASYYTNDFKYEDNKFLGAAAKIFDQQYQLLDGIVPGEVFKVLEKPAIEVADIPAIISAEYSGGGIIVDINSEEDRLTTDDLPQIAELLEKSRNSFRQIGESLKNSDNKEIAYIYKNMKFQEDVIIGKIQLIEDQPKLNREQRRAVNKRSKK